MGRRIRIPGLLDLLIVHNAGELLETSGHTALDRGPTALGPIGKRMVLGIAGRTLSTGTRPLPSAVSRDDPDREAAQDALAARLDPSNRPWDDDSLDAIAAYLKGEKRPLGPLCQQLIGRLFVPDFRATPATWRAARVLQICLTTRNPLVRMFLALTGQRRAAQQTLTEAMNGDTSAVHAIGVAVHTFLRAVERLEQTLADPTPRRAVSTKAALGRAVSAPDTVLRHASAFAETPAGPVAPGTVVMMQLDRTANRQADPRIAFLSESWSACPAARLVPAMLAEIWTRTTGERLRQTDD